MRISMLLDNAVKPQFVGQFSPICPFQQMLVSHPEFAIETAGADSTTKKGKRRN
jgi:hypothetical protein